MGWGKFLLLGAWDNRMDIEGVRSELSRNRRRLRQENRRKRRVDADQNARLDALERENDELKLYFSTVVKLLVARQVLTPEEVAGAVEEVEREEPGENDPDVGC